MSPAMIYMLQAQALSYPTTVFVENKEIGYKGDAAQSEIFMLGIPVEYDKNLRNSIVELRWNGAVLFTIDNLAIPLHFDSESA